jgi:DNA polymerase III delta prime subunit
VDAMKKFAEAEQSKINALNAQNTIAVNEANAKREATVKQFNATLENQRQQFNVQNQRTIDQSNVVWRRAVNTANTAAVNASNQTNAQNLLNLSNWGLSSAWQQWRDEASWVNTSSENTQNRNHNLAMAALERSTTVELQDKASKDAMYQMIGKFGFDLLSGK